MAAGTVVLVDFGSTIGHEQAGLRPALVISSEEFEEAVIRLTAVVPCTTTARGWPNHVPLAGETGLASMTYAMTEQVRTIGAERVLRATGRVDEATLERICRWVHTWIYRGVA